MVTACYTSKVWELATYRNKQSVREKRIYAKLFKDQADRDLYCWESSHGVAAKTGPSTMEMEDDRAIDQNQCVALEVHSIQINKKKWWILPFSHLSGPYLVYQFAVVVVQ